MTETINLKEIKTKTVHAYYEDGLWDIMMGFLMLASAFAPALHMTGGIHRIFWYFVFFGIGMVIWFLGKRYITAPRIGRVNFGPKLHGSRNLFIGFAIIAVLLTLFLVLVTISYKAAGLGPIPFSTALGGMAIPIGAGITAIIIIGWVAYHLKLNRVYIYALMFGTSIIAAEIMYKVVGVPWDGILTFGVTGTIIVLVGAGYLIRFVRKYSKPAGV